MVYLDSSLGAYLDLGVYVSSRLALLVLSELLSLALALRASRGPISVLAMSTFFSSSSTSSSESVSSSEVVSVSSSLVTEGVCVSDLVGVVYLVVFCVVDVAGVLVLVLSERDKIFCLTSSVVNGAPVVRTAVDEAAEDSEEVLESELGDLVDFFVPASDIFLVAPVVDFGIEGFLCLCSEVTDSSSDSSALETA